MPTLAERGGDFSAAGLPAIYDPATRPAIVAIGNPVFRMARRM